MTSRSILIASIAGLAFLSPGIAGRMQASSAKVTFAHSDDTAFETKTTLPPATNDAASSATFKVISGSASPNGGSLDVLHDGRIPKGEDEPDKNFFFANAGGRILVDLGKPISVGAIASYSWHNGSRAPQVYDLYASDGTAATFKAEPGTDAKPEENGWTPIAKVDTTANGGGQHAVSIAPEAGNALGNFRYVLFDVKKNPKAERFSETFFSEIDITEAGGPEPTRIVKAKKILHDFASKDGKYKYRLDATEAPDLQEWCATKLIPEMDAWYPKIIDMLPVEGFEPATTITFTLKEAANLRTMRGVPAWAVGNGVFINAKFARDEQTREAVGAGVHEIVHVVQFGGSHRSKPQRGSRPPSWVTEGVADYIRWFLYEPQSKGAEITERNVGRAKYDASYRVTANFFDWVIKTHEKDLMRKLNVATTEGYSDDLFKEWTGKTVQELGADWIESHKDRLGIKE
jgi:hypothetical protein